MRMINVLHIAYCVTADTQYAICNTPDNSMGLFKSLATLFSGKEPADAPQLIHLGRVVPDASRCVQCGVCGYNCPVGIPVRDYACRGLPVSDPACISCGNCVNVCPRGTLRWETDNHIIVMERFAEQMGELHVR